MYPMYSKCENCNQIHYENKYQKPTRTYDQYVLYPLKPSQIAHIPHISIKYTHSHIKITLIQVK